MPEAELAEVAVLIQARPPSSITRDYSSWKSYHPHPALLSLAKQEKRVASAVRFAIGPVMICMIPWICLSSARFQHFTVTEIQAMLSPSWLLALGWNSRLERSLPAVPFLFG